MGKMKLNTTGQIPVEVVFTPSWWHKNAGLCFDEGFFFDAKRRIEDEQKMERVLYERWGKYGIGKKEPEALPVVGPVHLASGFMLSQMLGCDVIYSDDAAPQVVPARTTDLTINLKTAFESKIFRRFEKLCEELQNRFGFLVGDVNFSGILNLALDLRGEDIYLDLYDQPEKAAAFFSSIAEVIERFSQYVYQRTGTTSISVNRTLRHFKDSVFLHSECSHAMISTNIYEEFLVKYDKIWSSKYRPFGIHFCGSDPHRFKKIYKKLPFLDFLDLGYGGDIEALRTALPDAFFNLRLSPAKLENMTQHEIELEICDMVKKSQYPELTGVCCINVDHNIPDNRIDTIYETVAKINNC